MKKESILKRLDTEVVKVFVKKNTTHRVEIIFAKPEGLDLENRKWKALNCASFFILKRYRKEFSFPFYNFIIKK